MNGIEIDQVRTELTCLSVSPSQRVIAVGGRSTLRLYSIRNESASSDEDDDADSYINEDNNHNHEKSESKYHQFNTSLVFDQELSTKTTTDLSMNPTMENVLAVANTRRFIELWDLASASAVPNRLLLSLDRASVTRLSWQTSDPNTLLIGASDGLLRVADIRSQDPVHTVMSPKSREIRDCQFNPHDNCTLAACFDNGTVQTFDSRQPKQCARRMFVHDGNALCLSYHPTRRGILASGGASSSHQGQEAFKLKILAPDHNAFIIKSVRVSGVNAMCWRSHTNEIATSMDSKFNHDISIWNVEDSFHTPLACLKGHSNQVSRIAFLNTHSSTNTSQDLSLPDKIVSVGRDGRICLQIYQKKFLPRQGRAFCWSQSDFVSCDDPVSPRFSTNRGKASVKTVSMDQLHLKVSANTVERDKHSLVDLCKWYRFRMPDSTLAEIFDWNASAASRAQNYYAMKFWKTLSCLYSPLKPSGDGFNNHRGNVSVIQQKSSLSSADEEKMGESITTIQAADSTFSKRSMLRELSAADPSVARSFHIRSKLPAFRHAIHDIEASLSTAKERLRNEDDGGKNEPHVVVVGVKRNIPLIKIPDDSNFVIDRIVCVGRSLEFLVDSVGDVHTAVVCVLIYHFAGLSIPTSITKFQRWVWALTELLQRKELFPQALEYAREANSLIKKREDIPESRVGMGCGVCKEPLPALGADGECLNCSTVVAKCVICRQTVHGMYISCMKCGHGGHMVHMQEWFADNLSCPSGCQCICMYW
jgi:hypothetical protein